MTDEQIIALMQPVKGWLSDEDAKLLMTEAEGTLTEHPDSVIAEVGSYHGRSTVVLAAVAQRHGAIVHAIDPHLGNPGDPVPSEPPTWDPFLENLTAAGVRDSVHPIRLPAWEADLNLPIGFLFLDGLHHYENVRGDFDHFLPLFIRDARVLFHDYGHPEPSWGVRRLVTELVDCGDWEMYAHAQAPGKMITMVALRRTGRD